MLTEKDEMLTDQIMSFTDKKEWFCPETKVASKHRITVIRNILGQALHSLLLGLLFDVTTTISVFQNNERGEKKGRGTGLRVEKLELNPWRILIWEWVGSY